VANQQNTWNKAIKKVLKQIIHHEHIDPTLFIRLLAINSYSASLWTKDLHGNAEKLFYWVSWHTLGLIMGAGDTNEFAYL